MFENWQAGVLRDWDNDVFRGTPYAVLYAHLIKVCTARTRHAMGERWEYSRI